MIAAHVNSKTKEEEKEKSNTLYDIFATGGGKIKHLIYSELRVMSASDERLLDNKWLPLGSTFFPRVWICCSMSVFDVIRLSGCKITKKKEYMQERVLFSEIF